MTIGSVSAYVGQSSWNISVLDSSNNSESYLSFVIDSNDNSHMTYTNSSMDLFYLYMTNPSGTPSIEIIDSTMTQECDIAVDSLGYPIIVYQDGTDDWLRYAWKNATGWNKGIVDGDVEGRYPSIVFDSSDYPHIAFYGRACCYGLNYIKWNGVEWINETIESEWHYQSGTLTLVLDSADNPHILYNNATSDIVYYTYWDGASWNKETIIDDAIFGVRTGATLTLDSLNQPHIVYYDNSDLVYTKKVDGSWSGWVIEDSGSGYYYPSIQLDKNENPHIAYNDYSVHNVKYAKYDGYYWEVETIDNSTNVGHYTQLEFNSTYSPFIAYIDAGNKDVKYAYEKGDTWEISHGIYGNVYLLPLLSEGKDAVITCENDNFNTSTTVNTTGYYIFDKIAAGIYWINATLYNYIDNIAIVEVVAGHDQTTLDNCDEL